MIRHIVFFTAREAKDREAIHAGLSILKDVPHGRNKEIGRNRNVDAISDRVDFVVYGEFEDEAELAAYKAHPLYQRSIELVRPLRELRIAADFESEVG
jgi:Stress responsive A/B Barrel Domain.